MEEINKDLLDRFLAKTGDISKEDEDKFESFKRIKKEQIVVLLETGMTFEKLKSFSIWVD